MLTLNAARNAVAMVVAELWRPLVVLLGLAGLLTIIFSQVGDAQRASLLNADTGSIAVYEQMRRAETAGPANIVFVGDSSCLMGIDPSQFQQAVSLCSIGTIGPEIYGDFIERYGARYGTENKIVVIAIHADSMNRGDSWDEVVNWVKAEGPPLPSKIRPKARLAIRWVRDTLVDPVISTPMKGPLGLYYGSVDRVRREIQTTGHIIDAGTGLDVEHIEQPDADIALGEDPPARLNDYCRKYETTWINSKFESALETMRPAVQRYGKDNVYVLITPLPRNCLNAAIAARLTEARSILLTRLGLADDQAIDMPHALETKYFSTPTHLNRFGARYYSEKLRSELIKKMRCCE